MTTTKYRYKLILILSLIILYSCNNKNKKIPLYKKSQKEINEEHTYNKLLQNAIDNHRIKDYFEDFIKKGRKLYIIENKNFNRHNNKLKWNNSVLETLTFDDIDKKDGIDYLIFTRVDIRKDSAFINFYFSYAYINSENIFTFNEGLLIFYNTSINIEAEAKKNT